MFKNLSLFILLLCLNACQKQPKISSALDNLSELSHPPMGASTYNDELKLELSLLDNYLNNSLDKKLEEQTKKALMSQQVLKNNQEKALANLYLTLPEILMPTNNQNLNKDWLKAKYLFLKRRFIESSILLSSILEKDPKFYQARNFRARSLFFLGNPHLALSELEKITQDKNVDQENLLDSLYLTGAIVHESLESDKESLIKARIAWQKYLEISDNERIKLEVKTGLADLKQRLDVNKIEIIDIFLPQKTYSENKNQALIAFINGDLDSSLKFINDSQDKELKLLKARILFKKSQIQEADIIFNELAKKYPKFPELWHYQGMAFMLKGETLEAITAWQKVMSLNKPYALFHKLDQRIAVAQSMLSTEQKIPTH